MITTRVHETHCCPLHGCKYGDSMCPIESGQTTPDFPHNNGCEACEGLETLFVNKCPPTADPAREEIFICPEVRDRLARLLYHPAMRTVGYSAFINRACELAERDIARGKQHDQEH